MLQIFPLSGCDDVLDSILSFGSFDIFYGKLFGFQFPSGLRTIFTGLLVAMSSFGRSFKSDSPELVNKVFLSFKKKQCVITLTSAPKFANPIDQSAFE